MASHRLTTEEARRAEALVASVQGVSSCRIRTDEAGHVTEVHVVSRGGKSPKLIARDVEGVLKAEMNVDVDYKKIGVVVLDAEPEAPADSPPEEFPILEHASRFAFVSVNVVSTRTGMRAEVELSRDSAEAFGSSESDNPAASPHAVIAQAALRAVSEFLDDDTRLCLGGVLKVSLAGKDVILARVDVMSSRYNKPLAGSAMVDGNEAQAVVFAALDAINRLIGKLEFKSSVEYKIK
ncbi:MAG TPA: hypothetical protein VFU38_03870 [Candidatus Krumholzibacteria bacterium]|nr:hypothetical protein [Candidatus Krumholzibacteria bacterium]